MSVLEQHLIAVSSLIGVGRIPSSKPAALAWLDSHGVTKFCVKGLGGTRFEFDATSLPKQERLAFTERQIATAGLAAGTYDDDAPARFFEAPAGLRAAAERAAATARYMVPRRGAVQWADLVA